MTDQAVYLVGCSASNFAGSAKRISGHKTLIMVERYAHQNGAHIQAAMDALEARYTVQPLPTAQRR